jgi:Ca2+-binding RTX toxin-like protein
MGSGVTAAKLDPVAYDGTTNTDTNSIVVTDFGQLAATLTATAQATPINGSLLTGGTLGADGGHVGALTINGTTYTYNPASGGSISVSGGPNNGSFTTSSNTLTVTTATGGSLAVDMDDGAFTYTPPATISGVVNESIAYTLMDSDGDTASATLSVNIDPANGPLVIRDDRVVTNAPSVAGDDPIVIPKWALQANDTGPGNSLLTITAIVALADGSVSPLNLAASTVTFNDNDTDGGTFRYTASNGDTAVVTVIRDTSAPLGDTPHQYLNDILLGSDSSADTQQGGSGDDILIGLGGNDVLNGGEGNDILAGGADTDALNGGNGNDTASYIDAGSGVTVSLLLGGAQTTGGGGTDTLSSIENLIGSGSNDSLIGTNSNNLLAGLAGDDSLNGNGGADTLIGGRGNDTLIAGSGADVLVWQLGDGGADGSPATDTVNDFVSGAGGDILDLRDLLGGVTETGSVLDDYLHFTVSSGTTTVHVSTDGEFASGYSATDTNQLIVLNGVDVGAGSDSSIITTLLSNGNLNTLG